MRGWRCQAQPLVTLRRPLRGWLHEDQETKVKKINEEHLGDPGAWATKQMKARWLSAYVTAVLNSWVAGCRVRGLGGGGAGARCHSGGHFILPRSRAADRACAPKKSANTERPGRELGTQNLLWAAWGP